MATLRSRCIKALKMVKIFPFNHQPQKQNQRNKTLKQSPWLTHPCAHMQTTDLALDIICPTAVSDEEDESSFNHYSATARGNV